VSTARAKKQLHKETKALAVDMENAYTRQLADRRHIPWLGIRAISDTAFENISPQVVHFVDGTGNARPWDITISLARKPMLIPQLIRLGRNTQSATKHLSAAIGAVIRSGWPFEQ
jgi:adenosylhomocysteine nucleosidase